MLAGIRRFLLPLTLGISMLLCSLCAAQEYLDGGTLQVGEIWGVQAEGVRYRLDNSAVCREIRLPDGRCALKMVQPGTVLVTAIFPEDSPYPPRLVYKLQVKPSAAGTFSVDPRRPRQHRNNFQPPVQNVEAELREVARLVNVERARAGLGPLRISQELMSASAVRARELVVRFSHQRPDGRSCKTAVKHRSRAVGENISGGHPSAASVVDAWMHSPGHRANILRPDYAEIGVGYCYDANSQYKHYWVQMFRLR